MGLPTDDCDDCVPSYARTQGPTFAVLFSALPFLFTFLLVSVIGDRRLFPFLSGDASLKIVANGPVWAPAKSRTLSQKNSIRRVSAFAFSFTIALAAVLAELVLCEISDTINPVTRGYGLRLCIFLLLILLVIVIPSLEIHSVIKATGWSYGGKLKIGWILHAVCFASWLFGFWWSGHVILSRRWADAGLRKDPGIVTSMTEHVAVFGISLMALLSGFASVSAPYQSFIAAPKPVSEAMVSRKAAGLESTRDMLEVKQSRLRALEQRLSSAAPTGFLQKATGVFRTNADAIEKKTLEMEISGLEDMVFALSTQHSLLAARRVSQQRAKSPTGKFWRLAENLFAIYCLWRIFAMTLTFVRRQLAPPDTPFVGADPINNILAVLVKHYDTQLDRAAWMRQISFLLSGVMILASVSSVLQTFHFFARFMPNLLRAAQANLALIIAQLCATYIISVSLLLRGIMPADVVGERLRAMGSRDLLWVDGWFETCFLAGVLVTGLGVWMASKIRGIDDWDEDEDVELGKRR